MKRIVISLIALMMVLAMGLAAVAENVDFTDGTAAETETADTAETEDTADDDESTALQDAQDAYRAAKQAERLSEYEAELKAMVEAGTLTQEQADLLLANAKEQASLRNGECPNCGYDFSESGFEGRGMKGGHGGHGRG